MIDSLRIFMGFLSLVFLVPGLYLMYRGFKYYRQKGYFNSRKCNKHIIGRVIGYSQEAFTSNQDSRYHTIREEKGIHIPLCAYEVEGQTYRIAGPLFNEYSRSVTDRPWESYEGHLEKLPLEYAPYRDDPIDKDPMQTLFPVGKEVDIYYCEADPSCAYVIRYYAIDTYVLLYFGMSIAFIAVALGAFMMCLLNISL